MIGAAWLGGWWLVALVVILSLIGLREFFSLATAKGFQPMTWWGMAIGAVVIVNAYLDLGQLYGLIALLFLAMLSALVYIGKIEGAVGRVAATVFGVLYIPWMLGHMVMLRNIPAFDGFKLLLFTFIMVWINDTAAYFTGMAFGKHRLAPVISPKKSVEGLAGGMFFYFDRCSADEFPVAASGPLLHGILIAVGVVALGTIGDLFESMLKRDARVKDSGAVLPGHGGVLDRFDSLLFAVPFVYWYCRLILVR